MKIYLIRHTTVAVARGICYGQSDVPLAPTYSDELKDILSKLPPQLLCYSSPSSRCLRLARDISANVSVDKRLRELNFGEWEMRPWQTLGPEAKAWGNNFVAQRCPGGESFVDLQQRILELWQEIAKQKSDAPIAIVTHAGPIRVILCHMQNKPLEEAFSIPLAYGQVISLDDF